jgi:hypothetical protein
MPDSHYRYLARALRIFELTRRKRFAKATLSELIDGNSDPAGLDMLIEQYGIRPPATQYSKKMIALACRRARNRVEAAASE